jgi:hypothetical protein
MTEKMSDLDTVSEVMQYYSRARKDCDKWHKDIEHRRRLYDMDHYARRPRQGEERYEDPTYTNTVDLAIGILMANDLEFKVHGWTPSMKEQKDSDQIEKLLNGIIQISSEREEALIPYEVNMNFVRDGCAVLYTVWDPALENALSITAQVAVPDEMDEGPEEQRGLTLKSFSGYKEPPLCMQVIDPLKVYLIPGGPNRWLHVFRVDQMPVLDIEMKYGINVARFANRTRLEKEAMVGEMIDYWRLAERVYNDGKTEKIVEHAVIFEGEVIYPLEVMDGYDDIPYTIGFFKSVNRSDPRGWGHSIIDPMETTISMLEKDTNRRHHLITKYAALPMVSKTNDGRIVQLDPSLGSLQSLRPDESIEFPRWEGTPPDIENEMAFLRARAQQSGFSDVLFGAGPSQVSGYALSQMGDQNRIRLEQPVQHLQLMWSRWAKKALRLCENFGAGRVIRVYGQQRGSEFYEQVFSEGLADYNVTVKIKPEFPNEKQRKHAMATQVMGILSNHTVMQEYLDIDQPGEEHKKRLLEIAQNNPVVQQYAVINLLREAAENGDSAAALTLQLLVQGGPPGQPGPTSTAQRGPEQLTGLASPTGQPPPQALGGLPPGMSEMDQMSQMAGAAPQLLGGVG